MLHNLCVSALIILYIFIGVMVINHVFTFLYLFIEHSLDRLKDPANYPATPLWRYVKNCLLEFIYMAGVYYLLPFKYVNMTSNLSALQNNPNPTAILLIHGYGRNQSDWLWFKKHLAELPCPLYCVNLAPTYAPIEQITSQSLPAKILQIKKQTNCKQIILIGHSMGGLVASYYSEFLDEENLVQNIIAITTPYYGTKISVAAVGANAKQMCPGNIFTQELRAKISRSPKRYHQVATQLDNIVFPWQSELLEDTPDSRQLIVPFESHLGTLHSEVVVNQVRDWVRESLQFTK